jgi:hypothetical protein
LLNEAGTAACWAGVVVVTVTVLDELPPLAMTTAMIPPATAPPMTGIHRLKRLISAFSSPDACGAWLYG